MIRYLLTLLALLVLLGGSFTPALAQEGSAAAEAPADAELEPGVAPFEDVAVWDDLASRAEAAVDAGRASTRTLDELRSDLADWRETFLALQGTNASRMVTVQGQIAALGPPPEDGGSEDPRIAARRADLQDLLTDLRAPGRLAEEAHARADGLIREIDALIRDRRADQLTERVQSPLNPAGWQRTWTALGNALRTTRGEITTAWATTASRQAAIDALPAALLSLIAGLVLLLRGRRWTTGFVGRVTTRSRRGRGVWRFLISLGQVILPVIGLVLVATAISTLGIVGRRGQLLLDMLPAAGFAAAFGHWIARLLLFPTVSETEPALYLPEEIRPQGARLITLMGYVIAGAILVQTFVEANGLDTIPASVLAFVMGAIMSVVLFRLGMVLRGTTETGEGAEDDTTPRSFRFVARRLLARALVALAVLGVLAGAFGYVAAFELLVFPAGVTLFLFALLVVLQRLSVDLYTLLSGIDDGAQDALIPVLIGFALAMASLPILALIWGARQTDLTELWARFQEGFAIGETRISPSDFLTFAVVFVVGYTVTRLLQGALRSSILPRTKMDIGGQNAVVAGMGYVGIFLAALIAISTAGIDLSGLAIVAGALSVGIGFGLQNIVSNFVSGIILLIERPISQGDWIEVNGQMGYVRDISVRSTRIETFDRTDVIVPNADLVSGQVTNWTRGNSVGRVIVPVGVAYGTDTDRVATILQEIAEAHPMVLANPAPSVVFQGFGADSLDFEIRAILRDVNWVLSVKSEMNHAIAKRFAQEGIEIPFAQRDIWLRNPEALRTSDPGNQEDGA